jgi:colanic acid/amylovoran biosynthesis glycosyltransferase
MRIAVLVGAFPTVSETFIVNQVTGLLDRGHDVRIIAEKVGKPEVIHSEIITYGLMDRVRYSAALPEAYPRRFVAALPLFGRFVLHKPVDGARFITSTTLGRLEAPLDLLSDSAAFRELDSFDVLLCHFGPMGARAVRLRQAGIVRGRVATFFHGFDVSALVRRAGSGTYGQLFGSGDLFLPISDHWRQRLIALGCPAARTAVHRMGIDCSLFDFAIRDRAEGEPLRLVTVARLVEKKGVEYAIRAVARLVEKGVDVVYSVVGDGPLRGALEKLVTELGLSGRVKILGALSHADVVALLASSHIMVAPSVTASNGDMEGIPVAIMEAMASGLPVVSTQHSGIPELISDGVTGYLVPERDTDALAEKLHHVAEHAAEWPLVARAARAFVEEHHDIAALNDQLARRLETLLRGVSVSYSMSGELQGEVQEAGDRKQETGTAA